MAHPRFLKALSSLDSSASPAPDPSQLIPHQQVRLRYHPFFVNHKQRLLEDGSERPAEQPDKYGRVKNDVSLTKLTDPYEEAEKREKASRLKELAKQDGLILRFKNDEEERGDTGSPSSSQNVRKGLPDTTKAHRLLRWIQRSEKDSEDYFFVCEENDARMGTEGGYLAERDEEGPYEERTVNKVVEKMFKVQFAELGNIEDDEVCGREAKRAHAWNEALESLVDFDLAFSFRRFGSVRSIDCRPSFRFSLNPLAPTPHLSSRPTPFACPSYNPNLSPDQSAAFPACPITLSASSIPMNLLAKTTER